MKYSHKFAWESVGKILPSLLYAKEDGVNLNLPECLKMAACECWLLSEETDFKLDFSKQTAGFVIKTALLELNKNGYIAFGDKDHL